MILSEHILFYAFRYALGRKTYSVSDVSDTIIANWEELSEIIKRLIQKEIQEAIDEDCAGMECDIQSWSRILQLSVN